MAPLPRLALLLLSAAPAFAQTDAAPADAETLRASQATIASFGPAITAASDAVAADPKKREAFWRRSGVVFDGWKRQKSDPDKMTYLFKDWYRKLDVNAHLIGDDE